MTISHPPETPSALSPALRQKLGATTLWLAGGDTSAAATGAAAIKTHWGFGKVRLVEAGGSIEPGQHLLVNASQWPGGGPELVLSQLPLEHLLAYAFGSGQQPLVGLRYEDQRTTMRQSWQLAGDLTIQPHLGSGACQAALVPAGVAAFQADSAAEAEALLNRLSVTRADIAGCRGYPLATFTEGAYDASRRAVFLDRDGVINVDSGYGHRPKDFQFVPGVVDFLHRLQDQGWRLVIVTNQAGVAKGKFAMAVAEDYHRYIAQQLKAEGINILASALCPYHQDGSAEDYRGASILRKPQPGMALKLASEQRLALPESIMIGDKDSDRLRLPGLRPFILQGRYTLDPALPHYDSFDAILAALT